MLKLRADLVVRWSYLSQTVDWVIVGIHAVIIQILVSRQAVSEVRNDWISRRMWVP